MAPSADGPRRLLRAWQLAMLRFTVTLDESDRLNVAALAAELDRLGGRRELDDAPHFFRRTTSKLSAAINGQQRSAEATLDDFCNQIEEPRLRLAFAAAIGITHSAPAPSEVRSKRRADLFKGLPSRRPVSL
ncbi:hypothetical protein UNPF46_03000 [Bradyrhizobium sp. UNPF46]|nr:hypothetical protein UNPF46_03000 [Bradyrhizobium sp. UNPF46]